MRLPLLQEERRLHEQLASLLRTTQNALSSLNSKYVVVDTHLRRANDKLDLMSRQLTDTKTEKHDLQAQLHESMKERFEAEDKKRKAEFVAMSHEHLIDDLTVKEKLSKEDAAQAKKKCSAYRAENETLKRKLQTLISKQTAGNSALTAEITAASSAELGEMSDELEAQKELVKQYEEQVEKLQAELDDVKLLEQRQRLFVKKTKQELEAREKEYVEAIKSTNDDRRSLRAAQTEITHMRAKLTDLVADNDRLAAEVLTIVNTPQYIDQLAAKDASLTSPKPERPRSATDAPVDAAKRAKGADQAAFELQDKLIKQLRDQLSKLVSKRDEELASQRQDAERLAMFENSNFLLQDELDTHKLKHEYFVQNKQTEIDGLHAKLQELQEEKSRLLDLSQQGLMASSASTAAAAETGNEETLIQMTMALNKMARPKDEVQADYVAKLERQIATLEVQLDQALAAERGEVEDDERQAQLLANEEQSHEHTRLRLSEEMQKRMICEQQLMDAERQRVLLAVDHDALKDELRQHKQNNDQLAKEHASDVKDAEHAQEILLQKQKEMEKLYQRMQQMGPGGGGGSSAEEIKELKRDLAEESRNNERLITENKDLKRRVEQLNDMLQRELRKADAQEAAAAALHGGSVGTEGLAGAASVGSTRRSSGAATPAAAEGVPPKGPDAGPAPAAAALGGTPRAEDGEVAVEAVVEAAVVTTTPVFTVTSVAAVETEAVAARHFVEEQQQHAAQKLDITTHIDEIAAKLAASEATGSADAAETAALREEMDRLRVAAAAKDAEHAEAMRQRIAELEAAAAAAAAAADVRPPSSMRPRTRERMVPVDFDVGASRSTVWLCDRVGCSRGQPHITPVPSRIYIYMHMYTYIYIYV